VINQNAAGYVARKQEPHSSVMSLVGCIKSASSRVHFAFFISSLLPH